jgi:hypothetical protein
LASLALNLFALTNLDFLNVLLLLPSLMFSVSTLVGPFIMNPKPGCRLGGPVWAPRLLGWITSLGFYGGVAWFVARGGWLRWVGIILFFACFLQVLRAGLRYWGYPRRLRRMTENLFRRMAADGLADADARAMAQRIVHGFGGDGEKTKAALQRTGLPVEHQASVVEMVTSRVLPELKRPLADVDQPQTARRRFVCEFNRSCVLGLFTFLWFFIGPIPGLLVFAAPGGYRFMLPLGGVLSFAGSILALALGAYAVSLLQERFTRNGLAGDGLSGRIKAQYQRFQSLAREPGRLTALQTASLYALFTDVQTYVEQRGYANARQALGLIEQTLTAVSNAR